MSNLYHKSKDAINNGYVLSPRPGIWYFLKYTASYTGQSYNINGCPSGTSLAYIKTATEWADFKYLAGKVKFKLSHQI